jgi:uncharacterized protein involved in exopolysaccharide biosynthesis
MRRRILVFSIVFGLCAAASLAYTFMRPAIYLANARLQVTPGAKLTAPGAAMPDSTPAVLVEMQVLNSRPLLEKVAERLGAEGERFDAAADPIAALQEMLRINRIDGSNVILIEAVDGKRERVAPVVNALIDAYREQQVQASKSNNQSDLNDAREELRIVEQRVNERRRAVEAFRLKSNIVSAERDENRTLSRLKGLGTSLSTATDREAIAAGKVQALEQAIASGQRSPLARDNPTVASMEARLSQLREELRALEREYTPQYLDMDPRSRSLRTRIANLEQQFEGERLKSQQMALATAREELASAQATAKRLQQQMAEDKQSVQAFSRNFMDYQAMQDELKSLEQLRQAARQKVVSMEASELARKPRTQVIENATMPDSAWRPLYWRDAGISMVGSLVLGFLAVWFVEFFNRRDPVSASTSSTVIIPQPWVTIAPPDGPALAAPAAPEALANQSPVALAAPPARELSADEQRSLLAEAAPEQIPLLVCLLCGLTAGEAAALRVADVETLSGRLTVGGDGTRVLDVGPALAAIVARYASDQLDTPLLRAPSGKQMTEADVRGVVMTAALDAGIAKAHEVTPSTLRHTYVAFIARQGLRFSDLGRLVGPTPAEDLNALAALAPGIRRVGLDQIEKILPAVRELATG